MSDMPPGNDPADDIDDWYRRASARDPSRPSEAVRRAVLDHAAQLAQVAQVTQRGQRRPARLRRWWLGAGTLAAAVLAGLVVMPRVARFDPTADARLDAGSRAAAPPAAAPRTLPPPATETAPAPASASASAPAERLAEPRKAAPARVPPRANAVGAPAAADAAQPASLIDPDVDTRDREGRTALFIACEQGRIAQVRALLARGANPNAADAKGTTPLQAAVAAKHADVAAVLRRAGGH